MLENGQKILNLATRYIRIHQRAITRFLKGRELGTLSTWVSKFNVRLLTRRDCILTHPEQQNWCSNLTRLLLACRKKNCYDHIFFYPQSLFEVVYELRRNITKIKVENKTTSRLKSVDRHFQRKESIDFGLKTVDRLAIANGRSNLKWKLLTHFRLKNCRKTLE